MRNSQDTVPSIDPRLNALLNLLRATPPRDPEAVARARARYLAEVDELLAIGAQPINHSGQHRPVIARPKQRFTLNALRQSLAFTTILAVLSISFILFGGVGATAFASQSALPGDALYRLKTGLEETQVRLSHDAARQAELHLDFAERRLVEIASLISQGRFDDIHTATTEFEVHVELAIQSLEIVSAGDPAQANELTAHIAATLSSYSQILQSMLTTVPDTVKPVVERAILTSKGKGFSEVEFEGTLESITPDGWLISGKLVKTNSETELKGILTIGGLVKVHAVKFEDGSLTAREIVAASSDNSNQNENDNAATSGSNDNANTNANDNAGEVDSNTNSNSNDNEGNDDGSGQNVNENDNEQHDDNENRNDNENEGGDDDGGNHNDNDHGSGDNKNDNGGHDNDNGGGNDNHDD